MKTTRRDFLTAGSMLALSSGALPLTTSKADDKSDADYLNPIGGVISVAVTPYHEDHTIDTETMTALSQRLGQAGADGVFVAGSTGDMALLTIPEREALVAATRKGLGSAKKICAGVSDWSIPAMVDNTKRFRDAGADIAVVMAPIMFFVYSQAELTEFFIDIADRSALPVLLYHHARVSTPIEPETVFAVADHPNIIGMKETGANFERTEQILEGVKGKDFVVMQGNEPYAVKSLKIGCRGVLSALAGVWPELPHELVRANLAGDDAAYDKAGAKLNDMTQLFLKLMPTAKSFSYFGQTMKLMLKYRGWIDNTNVRMPGFTPDPAWEPELYEFLAKNDFPKE